MRLGGTGGANTGSGLEFERDVDLIRLFKRIPGYTIRRVSLENGKPDEFRFEIFYKGKHEARSFKKSGFYRYLEEEGVDWKSILSRQLLPDDALLVIVRETLFIIEVKYQQTGGSVDEKLQACDFKRKQYIKLVHSLGLKVEFIYVLSKWFQDPKYKDLLDYINSMNCHYTFDDLPLSWLGLPDGTE